VNLLVRVVVTGLVGVRWDFQFFGYVFDDSSGAKEVTVATVMSFVVDIISEGGGGQIAVDIFLWVRQAFQLPTNLGMIVEKLESRRQSGTVFHALACHVFSPRSLNSDSMPSRVKLMQPAHWAALERLGPSGNLSILRWASLNFFWTR